MLLQYAGNATQVTDEASKVRLFQLDALGRLTKTCEVTAGNARSPSESCGITSFGGTGYLTTSTYNMLDLLTQTVQGAQTRTSTFDDFGRITGSRIREVSTTTDLTYGYDSDSNMLSITDPRGTVNLEYDELHRLKRKKHGTTVMASYGYDGTQANNAIGRLITEKDGDFASAADKTDYTYDVMGQVLSANRTISSTVYAMAYTYDLMGNATSINYPSISGTRRLVEYAYNSAGEMNKVTDGTNPASKFDYVTAATYSNLGPVSQLDFLNSVRSTLAWNKRFQLTSLLTQKVGGTTYLNLAYSYFNNSQIQQITNNLDSLKTEKFTYDELVRLLTAQRGPDNNIQRKYSYDFDRYGNRWAQTVVAGTGYNTSHSFDTINNNNRVTTGGFSHDASGNLTANGPSTTYGYDQENFLTSAAGTTSYKLDAQGRRVQKTVSGTVTDYFYWGADIIADKTGSAWKDYIFFGGLRIAQQTGATSSTATYLHPDHRGSTRVCTDSSGNSNGTCDYEPYGEVQLGSTCTLPTDFRFVSAQRDAETDLYHFWFRQYDTAQGRWMGVDPLPGGAEEPQSLDRYTYVINDPENLVDPLGLVEEYVCRQYDYQDEDGVWRTGLRCVWEDVPGGSGGGRPRGQPTQKPSKPANPCKGKYPGALQYDKPLRYANNVVQTARQHITERHLTPGTGGGQYRVTPPHAPTSFAQVQLYNALTFAYPSRVEVQDDRIVFTKTFPPIKNPINKIFPAFIGRTDGPNPKPLNTNRLVVDKDCETVRTSYPVP